MKEILGGDLKLAFEETGIKAKMTYQNVDKGYEVWELSDKKFEKLCSIKDEDWKDDWGWWRSAECSNMGYVDVSLKINNHSIWAWSGSNYEEDYENKEYDNLLEYFCYELNASQPSNVCALAVDLAQQNNITMSELFKKYVG